MSFVKKEKKTFCSHDTVKLSYNHKGCNKAKFITTADLQQFIKLQAEAFNKNNKTQSIQWLELLA